MKLRYTPSSCVVFLKSLKAKLKELNHSEDILIKLEED